MKKIFKLKKTRAVVVISLAILIAIALVMLKPKTERVAKIDKGFLVEVFSPKLQSVNMSVETYGTVEPRETLKLMAEVMGSIDYIHLSFVEGGYVEKGTRLIGIDPRPFSLALRQSKVRVDQAKAALETLAQEVANLESSIEIAKDNLNIAKTEFARMKELFNKKVIAKTTLDKAEQAYLGNLNNMTELENRMALTYPKKKELVAAKEMAEVAKKQAELDLDKASIKAPFDGWILNIGIKKGEYVKIGDYIGSLYKKNIFDIDVNIAAKNFKWILPLLDNKKMPVADVIFRDGETHIGWRGKVVRSKSSLDMQTRMLPLVVEVNIDDDDSSDKKGFSLRPGMFVTVIINGRDEDDMFVLPRHMLHENNTIHLFKDSRLEKRKVEVLRIFKELVYISGGLSESDLVIKNDIPGAVESMLLRKVTEKMTKVRKKM